MSGQIIDASLVPAPKQRNTEPEKEAVKAGRTAQEIWPGKPNKAAQKDVDARWTLKIGGENPLPTGWYAVAADRLAGVRLQIAYRDRPAYRLYPGKRGYFRIASRWTHLAQGRHHTEYLFGGLGRQRLSVAVQ